VLVSKSFAQTYSVAPLNPSAEALRFLDVLVLPPSRPPSPTHVLPFEARANDAVEEDDEDDPMTSSQLTV